MPVMSCHENGKPGYKWGESGKCYTYTPDDDNSRAQARSKAALQGKAIQVNKSYSFDVKKSVEDQNIVFGWAYVTKDANGKQVVDHSSEYMPMDELEMAMYAYNVAYRGSGEVHKGRIKGVLIESMVFTKEKQEVLGIPEGILPEGAWVGIWIPDDKVFQKVKTGEYAMFSIEGRARRREVD